MPSTPRDYELLERFDADVRALVPHLDGETVVNPTPLADLSGALLECARAEYGLNLRNDGFRILAKLDSKIAGGSVKVRPAVGIVREAIASGRLARGQTIFEATSGNFGLALGRLRGLGVDVVALVSRRLEQGVLEQLRKEGVRVVNLDIDVCPAPGLKGPADLAIAKGVAAGVRQQLSELGFDSKRFDGVIGDAEELLARQDAIGLAKLLAHTYGGFCPEQYDNELNVETHRTVTGPEIDSQLAAHGTSLGRADFVCAFGTGGTAGGVSKYVSSKHHRRGVRVVFPLSGQDVAGIRTKEKAAGLKFYDPGAYLGEHEVDSRESARLFEFFNRKGYDIGESGALALYACMQLVNYGIGKEFVVMVADGAAKYTSEVGPVAKGRDQVGLDEAASAIGNYGGVMWAHTAFIPKTEGIMAIASSLGCDESQVKVADVEDVQAVLSGKDPSAEFKELLPEKGTPVLVVCMAGNTSLMLAKALGRKGVAAESLIGGITGLPAARGRQPFELVEIARPRNSERTAAASSEPTARSAGG